MDDKLRSRRNFLAGCCAAMGAVAFGAGTVPALSAWRIAKDLKFNLTEKEVDISGLKPGEMKIDGISLGRHTLIGNTELIVPVLILKRKPHWIDSTEKPAYSMKEPVDARQRYLRPEWFIARAFCTHLGCTPNIIDEKNNPVNIVCPCHGGRYDTLGRIISGPPPSNLYLVPYRFTDTHTIRLSVASPEEIVLRTVSEFRRA